MSIFENFIYLMYFCLCLVFTAVHGLSLVAVKRFYSVAVCRLLTVVAALVEHRLQVCTPQLLRS